MTSSGVKSFGCVKPYNADFDGDEMNLHLMQSDMANAEVAELIAVSKNINDPKDNAPCLSLVQDSCVGSMLLTRRTTRIDLDTMHQCFGVIKYKLPGKTELPEPAEVVNGEPFWTGKQLVSLILPPIFLERRVRGADSDVTADDPHERYVHIRNGELLSGTLCKATLGGSSGSIIHRILTEHGEDAVIHFMSDLQRVIYEWLPTFGLTMGLRDCMISPETRRKIEEATTHADNIVSDLTKEAHELEAHMTPTEIAHIETLILTILTSVLDYSSRLVLEDTSHESIAFDPSSPFGFRAMVDSKSKGNKNNIAQVMACLGQQVVEGQRVIPGKASKKTLPMFAKGAFSAAARGFISRGYLYGMMPWEYFFHMQAGREGLVATAVKTAETGYKYRSMTKAMETNTIRWDLTVRNGQDYIIEFSAGGDCMDPTKIERVNLPVIKYGNDRIKKDCGAAQDYAARIIKLRDAIRVGLVLPFNTTVNTRLLMPVNVVDELDRVSFDLSQQKARFVDKNDASDEELTVEVLAFLDRVAALLPSRETMAGFELAVMYECRPEALRRRGITPETFKHTVAAELYKRFLAALAHPGESVGVVAGQSLGEPATQFTLNVFHYAGLMQRLLTVGVPRLKELLHASVNIKTPAMVIPFRDPRLSALQRSRYASSMQFLCLDSVLHSSYPQFDPPGDGVTSPLTTMHKDHNLMMHVTKMFGPERGIRLSPWILRLVLNRAVLSDQGYTPETVARVIAKQMDTYNLSIIYSQPNMSQWVLRIRIDGDESEHACRSLHGELRESVLLGGIDGIRHACVIDMDRIVEGADGSLFSQKMPVIDAEGTGLMKVATRDWADWENTVTNDVQEVVRTLGLAAGKALLFSELDRVISQDGGYVDARHIRQVVNTMSHRGYLMPCTRHGINRVDATALQHASYEEPVDMIFQGAMTGEEDKLNGICSAIIFGQKPPIGTGTVAIQQDVFDTPVVSRSRPVPSSREQDLLRGKRKRFRNQVGFDGPRKIDDKLWEVAPALPDTAQQEVAAPWATKLTPNMIVVTDASGSYFDSNGCILMRKTPMSTSFRPSSPTTAMLEELKSASAVLKQGRQGPV